MGILESIRKSVYDYRGTMTKGEILGNVIEDCFNGHLDSKDEKELCHFITHRTHRYLQSQIFKFCLKYIKTYAEMPDTSFDGRNDWVHKTAKEICDTAISSEGYKIFEYEEPIGINND